MKDNRPTIGFLTIANFRSSLAQELVAGINSAAKEFDVNIINFCNGYRYSLGDSFSYASYFKRIFPYLTSKNIDGVISWASSMAHIMPFEEIPKIHTSITGIPIVCLGMELEYTPSIVIDNEMGMRHLMQHLTVTHGFTKIVFIGDRKGSRFNYCNTERYDAYRAFLSERRIPFRDDYVIILDKIDINQINKVADTLFGTRKLRPKIDIEAIVTVSDIVSNRIVEVLKARKIRVPEDIAVVGFNNTFEGIRSDPPLTTVDPLYYRYGYTAVQMILDQLDRKKVPHVTRMPVEFLIRQSCGCYEDSIARVSEENCPKKISVEGKNTRTHAARKVMLEALAQIIRKYDPDFNPYHVEDLYDSLMKDITHKNSRSFITALKKYFFNNKYHLEILHTLDNVISEMRKQVLPALSSKKDRARMAEDIFHQARVMINLSTNYITMIRMHYTYQLGRIAFMAADYNAVNNFGEFDTLFRSHLMEVDIPGAIVVVINNETGLYSGGRIVSSYQRKANPAWNPCDMEVLPGCILPKKCYPRERFSLMFQTCNYREEHLGYIVFEMGPMDIILYDTMRMITAPSVWRLLRTDNLQAKTIPLKPKNGKSAATRLVSRDIMECLARHIDEPTRIPKFAAELGVSVTTLIRRSKSLAGSSIQKLHEKLKMERALSLLENREYSIAEISEKLGYANQFYFSAVFKRYTGMPPLKWMKIRNP
ncbi:MAG: helix-turn-helix domain-containing protein [Spirochaetaceae bacterium]|nr:MAG: helix-turn-helix domain-containing protein [Spirochaetaceae bacterium]